MRVRGVGDSISVAGVGVALGGSMPRQTGLSELRAAKGETPRPWGHPHKGVVARRHRSTPTAHHDHTG